MPRKSRKRSVEPQTFLHPINIKDFGDPEKDPCFGKLYDLSANECQICGDFELCSIAFAQKLQQKRLVAETKTKTKDLELNELDFKREVRKFYEDFVLKGNSKARALRKASRRYRVKVIKVKELIKQ